MPKFQSIEGLRGVLAWTVVASHLAWLAPQPGLFTPLRAMGIPAVFVFLIISGFVITHTLLIKKQSYPRYIVRRLFRIFPLFAVTCAVGYVTSDLIVGIISDPEFATEVAAVAASDHGFLPFHVMAHATMLHGLIPDHVLPYSSLAFNMPAWIISLQWQFYLVAPLIVIWLHDRPLTVAVILALVQWVWTRILGGPHAMLPFAVCYFAIGILCRLHHSDWRRLAVPMLLLSFQLSAIAARPVLLWLLVLLDPPLVRQALGNPVALYCGSRSYAVYLCHYPVLCVVAWWLSTEDMELLMAISIPLIVIVAELAYRLIERPGIALGKYLTS